MLHAEHEQQQTPLNDVYVLSIRLRGGDGISRHHLVTGDQVPGMPLRYHHQFV